MYYVFSFRSRNQSIGFFETAIAAGLNAKIIHTPRAISIGCGLSVKICACDIAVAEEILHKCAYDTFLGLFYYNGAEVVRIRN